jgi:hypothetical protein
MTRFPSVPKIIGVSVGEVRIKNIGSSPSTMAKFALVTEDARSAGLFIQHEFSDRTHEILRALYQSMEMDVAETLSSDPSAGDQQEWDDDDEDLNFR